MPLIREIAPAKINLALHVRHRRPDGYHAIETLFAFCREGDTVSVARADDDSFAITGPFAAALTGYDVASANGLRDNLVVRAARSFAGAFAGNANHAIILDKQLPVASGIGGGSADAAATLRALARHHGIPRDHPDLGVIARSLGADVSACLAGVTALGTGRGDILDPRESLADTPVLLVNPGVAVSTTAVFAGWDGIDRGPIASGPTLAAARAGRNDLEAPARRIAPEVDTVMGVLREQPGAALVRMSGSGATCFALFGDRDSRDMAARRIAPRGWWQLATGLA